MSVQLFTLSTARPRHRSPCPTEAWLTRSSGLARPAGVCWRQLTQPVGAWFRRRRIRRASAQAGGRRWSGRTAGAESKPLPGTMAARPPGRASGLAAAQRGSLLILTLWLLVFLSTLLIMLGDQILGERRVARAAELQYQQLFARETLRARFEVALALDDTEKHDALTDTWSQNLELFRDVALTPEGSPTASLAAGESQFGAIDEERFININLANLQLLKQVFIYAAGLDEEAALLLAAAVQDWRDLDSVSSHPDQDTEGASYSSYPCKNNTFESVEELMLVSGMDETIYRAVRPVVTVYGKGKVNINTTPKDALIALGAPETLAGKILAYRKGDDGVEATEDDGFFEDVVGIEPAVQAHSGNLTTEELNALTQMKSQGWLGVTSDYFRLPVQLKAYGKYWTKNVVVSRKGKFLEINR